MSNPNGENFQSKPVFENALLPFLDPNNEVGTLIDTIMGQATGKALDAIVSGASTDEVGNAILASANWAVSLHYTDRAKELMAMFTSLGLREEEYPELCSDYRFLRFRVLMHQSNLRPIDRITQVEPIIEEERILHGTDYSLPSMIGQMASVGYTIYFSEWLFLNVGDLSKRTPDDGDRFDPERDDMPYSKLPGRFTQILYDVQRKVLGYTGDEPDPFVLNEYIAEIESFCSLDLGHEASLDLLRSAYRAFSSSYLEELGFEDRVFEAYLNGLKTFLSLNIPKMQGGLVENHRVKRALSEYIELGWQMPELREQINAMLDGFKETGCFTAEDKIKIDKMLEDRRRRVKRKGSVIFTWADGTQTPPL